MEAPRKRVSHGHFAQRLSIRTAAEPTGRAPRPGTASRQRPSTASRQRPSTASRQRPSAASRQRPGTASRQRPKTATAAGRSSSWATSSSSGAAADPADAADRQPPALLKKQPRRVTSGNKVRAKTRPGTGGRSRPSSARSVSHLLAKQERDFKRWAYQEDAPRPSSASRSAAPRQRPRTATHRTSQRHRADVEAARAMGGSRAYVSFHLAVNVSKKQIYKLLKTRFRNGSAMYKK